MNRPVTGWVRYNGDRDWQEARFATATPVTAARFYVQNLTSGKASSIDLHRVTKMDELEWGKEGVEGLDTVEIYIGGKPSFEAMWTKDFTDQILQCLWATVDEEANANAPDVVDLRGDGDPTTGPTPAWTPPVTEGAAGAPWTDGVPAGGPIGAPPVPSQPVGAPAPPPPPTGQPVSAEPPTGLNAPPPAPVPPGPGSEVEEAAAGKRRGWRGRRREASKGRNAMSPVVGVLAVAGCAAFAVGAFMVLQDDDDPGDEVLGTSITVTTVAPATTLAPGETTTTTTTLVPGG